MSDEQPKEVAPVVQPPPRLLQAAWAKATATPPRARSVAEADALLRHFAFDPVRHRRYASMHPGALNPFAKEWAPPQTPGSCAIGLGEISWDGVDPGGGTKGLFPTSTPHPLSHAGARVTVPR